MGLLWSDQRSLYAAPSMPDGGRHARRLTSSLHRTGQNAPIKAPRGDIIYMEGHFEGDFPDNYWIARRLSDNTLHCVPLREDVRTFGDLKEHLARELNTAVDRMRVVDGDGDEMMASVEVTASFTGRTVDVADVDESMLPEDFDDYNEYEPVSDARAAPMQVTIPRGNYRIAFIMASTSCVKVADGKYDKSRQVPIEDANDSNFGWTITQVAVPVSEDYKPGDISSGFVRSCWRKLLNSNRVQITCFMEVSARLWRCIASGMSIADVDGLGLPFVPVTLFMDGSGADNDRRWSEGRLAAIHAHDEALRSLPLLINTASEGDDYNPDVTLTQLVKTFRKFEHTPVRVVSIVVRTQHNDRVLTEAFTIAKEQHGVDIEEVSRISVNSSARRMKPEETSTLRTRVAAAVAKGHADVEAALAEEAAAEARDKAAAEAEAVRVVTVAAAEEAAAAARAAAAVRAEAARARAAAEAEAAAAAAEAELAAAAQAEADAKAAAEAAAAAAAEAEAEAAAAAAAAVEPRGRRSRRQRFLAFVRRRRGWRSAATAVAGSALSSATDCIAESVSDMM